MLRKKISIKNSFKLYFNRTATCWNGEQQVVQEQVVQVEVQSQLQNIQQYSGTLIGYSEFSDSQYKDKVKQLNLSDAQVELLYDKLKQELFANLPHAIKFLTPEAASQLAENLPGLVVLNKIICPPDFY